MAEASAQATWAAPAAAGVAREEAVEGAKASTRTCWLPLCNSPPMSRTRTCGSRWSRRRRRRLRRHPRHPEGRGCHTQPLARWLSCTLRRRGAKRYGLRGMQRTRSHRVRGAAPCVRLHRVVVVVVTCTCSGIPSPCRPNRPRQLFGDTWKTCGPCVSCRQTAACQKEIGRGPRTPGQRPSQAPGRPGPGPRSRGSSPPPVLEPLSSSARYRVHGAMIARRVWPHLPRYYLVPTRRGAACRRADGA